MKRFDDELREALAPLAGDPDATRDAVLAQLPRRRWPWRTIHGLTAAAAAGLLVGYGLGWLGAAPSPVDKPIVDEPPPQVALATPVARPRTVVGEVILISAADATNPSPLDQFSTIAADDHIVTGEGSYLELELAAGNRMRLAAKTDLQLRSDGTVELAAGHFWIEATDDAGLHIEQPSGSIETDPGAVIDVMAGDAELAVVTLAGRATLTSRNGTRRRIKKMQRAAIRGGTLRDREYVYWATEITFWQLPLLCGQPQRAEIDEMAASLIELIDDPDWGSMARENLRKMSECAMAPLLDFLSRTEAREQRPARRQAALLLADVAVYRGLDALFGLLRDSDPQVRVPIYRAIARVSGSERVDEEFWTMAPARVREGEAVAWQEEVVYGK